MTLTEVEKKIAELEKQIKKYDDKEAKGKKLTSSDNRNRTNYEKELGKYKTMKNQMAEPKEVGPKENDPEKDGNNTGGGSNNGKTLEERYQELLKKQQELADQLNNANLMNQKLADEKKMLEQTQKGVDQVDDNIEFNTPTWFWREAQEMAPTDKAKRGFIIANHVLNRLGTTTGNIGAIIQNAGGSGGAKIREHGGSYIDQYRQGKIEQAMANRKTKQNSLLQQQIDALVAIGVPENEARVIQNKLRNSKHWNKYNRLTNEQQVYIQSLLYNDTKGKINDAALGNFIDQLMEGKNVSLEQAAVNMMAAEGIDNIDEIKSGAKAIGDKVIKWLNWDKPGQ